MLAEFRSKINEKFCCINIYAKLNAQKFILFANYTGSFEMIVGVLQLVIHNKLEIAVYVFFYLNFWRRNYFFFNFSTFCI